MTKQIQKASSPTRVFPKKFEFDGSISENGRPGGTCGVLEERDEAPVCGGKPPHSSSSRTQSHQPEQINQPIGTRNEPTLRPNTQSGPSGGAAAEWSARPPSKKKTWGGGDELWIGKPLSEPLRALDSAEPKRFRFQPNSRLRVQIEPVRVQSQISEIRKFTASAIMTNKSFMPSFYSVRKWNWKPVIIELLSFSSISFYLFYLWVWQCRVLDPGTLSTIIEIMVG